MPIFVEQEPNTPIQQRSLNEKGWSGFNTPRSSNVGQTYGPGGMGMRAYTNRPSTREGYEPFRRSDLGYRSNVGSSMQTHGPVGMGMRAYMNRPGRYQGIGSLTPSNIGVDRHPITMDPIMTMLNNPQVLLDAQYARELDEQMDPDNFLTNRLAVGEKWGVDPFGDVDTSMINIQDFMNKYPDYNPYRLIKELQNRNIAFANRGGLMSLRR